MNMNGMPSFENIKKLCEPHIIFKETAAKLKRWSKFGLLRYGTSQKEYIEWWTGSWRRFGETGPYQIVHLEDKFLWLPLVRYLAFFTHVGYISLQSI